VLTLTLDGMPLVYNGQEAGIDRWLAFFDKDELTWRDHPMAGVYKTLLNLRKTNKALQVGGRGGRLNPLSQGSDRLFGFSRVRGEDGVIVMVNLTDEPGETVVMSRIGGDGYVDIFTGEAVSWNPGEMISFEPWGYRVLAR
jgi:glycosidase